MCARCKDWEPKGTLCCRDEAAEGAAAAGKTDLPPTVRNRSPGEGAHRERPTAAGGAGREDDILCVLGRADTTPSCGHERPPTAGSIPTCTRPSRDKGRVTVRAPRPRTGQDYAELPSPPLGRARLSKPVTALKLQIQETQRNPLRSCRNSNYIHILVVTYV